MRPTGDSALICSRNFKHTNYNLGKHDSQKQSAKSTSAPATTSVTASATTEFRFIGLRFWSFGYWALCTLDILHVTQPTPWKHWMYNGKMDYIKYKTPIPHSNCRQRANRNTMWWIAEITTHINASKDTSCSGKEHTKHGEKGLARSVVSIGVVWQNNCAVSNKTICYNKTINTINTR